MVTISQIWMIYTMDNAIPIATEKGFAIPRHLSIYMDDCWCTLEYQPTPRRPGLRSENQRVDPAESFNDCLNEVHPRVQFTREEEENNSIAFLDVHLTREDNGTISTKVYRKSSNTNITIKPQSCQNPLTIIATFKGELCRAHKLCSSPDQTQKEITFLLDLYEDNGHDRAKLAAIAAEYKPPSTSQPSKKDRNKRTQTKRQNISEDSIPENLFDILPFRDDSTTDEEYKPFACIPFIPGGTSYQLKRILTKAGVNTCFKSGTKLKDILCSKNKTKTDPAKKKGIYTYICKKCGKRYVGQTRRCCETRWKEHQRAIEKENWSHSGISQHYKDCDEPFDPANFEVIKTMTGKNKRKLDYDLKIWEALEIRKANCGPGKGMNEDWGSYVKTDAWNTVFNTMD